MTKHMFDMAVTVDIRPAIKKLKGYQRKQLPKLIQQSLNVAGRGMRTDIKRIAKKHIELKPARVGKLAQRIQQAKNFNGRVVLLVSNDDVPSIASFKITNKQRKAKVGKARRTGTGLAARVWESPKSYKGSFVWIRPGTTSKIAKTAFRRVKSSAKVIPVRRTGGGGAFRRHKRGKRKGKLILRQPVEVVFGASLAREVRRNSRVRGKGFRDEIQDAGVARFLKEFKRRLASQR